MNTLSDLSIHCEGCGRTVGQEILTCPDRTQGHCPYLKRNLVSRKSRLLSAGILFLGDLLSLWMKQQGDVLHTLISLVLVGVGFFGTFHTSTLLYNPISKLIWKRKALLGITLERTLIANCRPLRLDLSFSQSLLFPPSVTKLSEIATDQKWTWTGAANHLLMTTLVSSLARGLIQIHQYEKYVARGWGGLKRSQDLYLFTATEEADSASIEGALERRILLVLGSWATRKGEEALVWPNGPQTRELIRAIYDKDVSSPDHWVFDLVAQDAVARGWGRLEGWPRKRYKPSAAHEEHLRSERAIINELFSRFALQQPDLSKALAVQINEAVRSRTIQQTYDY